MTDEHGPVDPGSDEVERARWEAIHRFLDGLSTLPERREVQKWMHDDLAVQRYINAHRKVWSMIGRRLGSNPVDPEDAWDSLQDRIAEHGRKERFHLPGRGLEHLRIIDGGLAAGAPVRPRIMVWSAVAGSAAILVFSLVSYSIIRRDITPTAPIGYTAYRGQPAREALLPDGARMTLAPDSRAQFAIDRRGRHIVSLVGEGEFSVPHRDDRAFVVRVNGVETTDLGTEFDVRAYPGDAPRIAVKNGRVSVRVAHETTELGGGRIGTVDVASGTVRVADVGDGYFEWTSGQLMFVDTPLSDIAATLGRRYDRQFVIADPSLAALTVTITVPDGTVEFAVARLTSTVNGLESSLDGQKIQLFRQ